MTNEPENTDSPNGDELDAHALKEQLDKAIEESKELESKNRQLFERAKKAEGFEKDSEGNWIKTVEKEKPKASEKKQEEEFGLLHRTFLASAGVTTEEEVELAREIQKETGKSWEKLINDDYFKFQLEKFRDKKSVEVATSPQGGKAPTDAKLSTEFWKQKGRPPRPDEVPDRKQRTKIARELMKQETSGGKFYND